MKGHLKTSYEIFCKRILNITFLHVFGCPDYIHNHKYHLRKFDEKADDGYLLGYSLVSKAFRVFNTRRQQTEETYHITFDESPDAIKFSKPSINNINIAKNERYPPDKYLHPDKPSQMCQTNSNHVSFIEPYKCPELVILETEVSLDQNGAGMLTRAMAKELGASLAHECLFVDFLSEEEPKKVSEALQHPGWVDSMQDELNQFAKNKFWILVHAPYSKTIIGSEWVFRNKRDETRIIIKNKVRLVAQGYNQQEGIDYDETFAPVVRLKLIRIFLAFATYMNFIVYQMDVKSAFLNGKLKEEVYVKQPLGFESNEFPNHVCKLDKAIYGLKQAPREWYETLLTVLTEHKFIREKYVKDLLKKYDINGSSLKTPMVPPNKLGLDLNGKAVNETRYQANPKESHLIDVKRIFRKSTSGAYQLLGCKLVCLSAKKQQSVAMSLAEAEYVAVAGCCANILWMKSQLTSYDIIYEKVPIFCDNTSVIVISNNPVLHSRTKHIDIRYHFIRDHILKGDIE
ncbi:retrovirus-related pol polyprotein from transposon TNT 1-94 [Tanacetum coccineum]